MYHLKEATYRVIVRFLRGASLRLLGPSPNVDPATVIVSLTLGLSL